MGVPSLFRWLQSRYPKVTTNVVEIQPNEINGVTIPVDFSQPNPNGIEFDNLYLDMNGIIHPCCRPTGGKPAPETVDDMFIAIFDYIDRLMAMVRPRKLLYMAVDGVAPRAKMNQQRSRRFRAAQDAAMARAVEEEVFARTLEDNPFADVSAPSEKFDSNCITPGTPFMANLVVALRYYVQHRLNTDPGWRNLKVLMSDASVPGEGEHKVMDFIRRQRCDPSYDPNTHHVLYGLDADLIFLGLATHEPHFYILREDVFEIDRRQRASRGCDRCGGLGHNFHQCRGRPLPPELLKQQQQKNEALATAQASGGSVKNNDPYLFFQVAVMREYLYAELFFDEKRIGFEFDFERVLDDWVFICFFVGNDFLPHHPALEIREGAIDLLADIYRDNLKRMGGYLTEHGILNLQRVQFIFEDLARVESEIFHLREHKEREFHDEKRRKQHVMYRDFGYPTDAVDKMLRLWDKANDLRTAGDMHEADKVETQLRKLEVEMANDMEQGVMRPESTTKYTEDKYMEEQQQQQDAEEAAASPQDVSIAGSGMHVMDLKDKDNATLVQLRNATFDVKALAQPLSRKEPSSKKAKTMSDTTVFEAANRKAVAAIAAAKRTASEANMDDEPNDLEPPAKKLESEAAPEGDGDSPIPDTDEPEADESISQGADDDESADAADDNDAASIVVPKKSDLVAQNRKFKTGNAELGTPGYIERYYADKFGDATVDMRRKVGHEYVIGLCWVLHYYIKGCPSWKWFYPYHYAPFAADIMDVDQLGDKVTFELGEPFKPIEQLMGVFPAGSKAHIPNVFHKLMTDEDSEIIDFYPTEFVIDLNGKKAAWMGVALLPFIDEKRLLAAMAPLYPLLTEEDRFLNTLGQEVMMVSHANVLFPTMCMAYSKTSQAGTTTVAGADADGKWIELPMQQAHVAGQVTADPRACFPGATLVPPFPNHTSTMFPIKNNKTISVVYRHPNYKPSEFIPGTLKGAKLPRNRLTWGEIEGSFRRARGRNPHVLAGKFTHIRLVPPPGVNVQQERDRMAQQRGHGGQNRGGYGQGGRYQGGHQQFAGHQQYGGNSRNSYEDRGRQYDTRGGDNGGRGGYNDRGHRDQYGGGQQSRYSDDRGRHGDGYQGGHQGGHQGGYQGGYQSEQRQQRHSWNGGQSDNSYRGGNQGYQGGYDNRGGDRGGQYEGGYHGGNRGHGSGGYSHNDSRGSYHNNNPSRSNPAPPAPQFAAPSIPAGAGQQHAQMLALQLQIQQQLLAQRQAQQPQQQGVPIGVPARPQGPPSSSSSATSQQQQQRPPPGNLAWSRNLQRGGGPPSGR